MRHRTRKWLSLLVLLLGLPAYIVLVGSVMPHLNLPKWAEAMAYILLGVIWVLPFKNLFRGIGQAAPEGED